MAELTNEEIQEKCDLIQAGEKTEDYFPVSNRMYMGKWYYHIIVVNNSTYYVDTMRKVIF